MGWDDWTYEEEAEQGWVRGYRVQWSPHKDAGLIVHDEDDDDVRYVLVTGELPHFEVHGWITVREAARARSSDRRWLSLSRRRRADVGPTVDLEAVDRRRHPAATSASARRSV
jgi:hypothetical protein